MKNVISPSELSAYAKQQIESISYAIPNFRCKKKVSNNDSSQPGISSQLSQGASSSLSCRDPNNHDLNPLNHSKEIPVFVDEFPDTDIDAVIDEPKNSDELLDLAQLPAWATKNFGAKELERQREIERKIAAASSKKDVAKKNESLDTVRFGRNKPSHPKTKVPELLCQLLEVVDNNSKRDQETDPTRQSAESYAQLIAEHLMNIEKEKRLNAFDRCLEFGHNWVGHRPHN